MKIPLTKLFLPILILINISCNKEEYGDQPFVVNDALANTKILVNVSGIESLDGDIAIVVYNNSETFTSTDQYYKDTISIVTSTEMSIIIDSISPGTYAISVLHDANQNGEMDFGGILNLIPQEGFGYSNNPEIQMSQPNFEDCKFEIEKGETVSVPIILIYF